MIDEEKKSRRRKAKEIFPSIEFIVMIILLILVVVITYARTIDDGLRSKLVVLNSLSAISLGVSMNMWFRKIRDVIN